jgi:2,4-dienoyl-CoA reductase-like NADH-dependent reductase (Old Yellow Enzyme family)/thioredoxin reductase
MLTQKYPKVAEPIQIGPMRLKNRIVVLPMMTALPTPQGVITEEFINFCGRQARTGAGLVILGDSSIDNEYAMDHETAINLGTDFVIPRLYAVTEEIHRYGAKASIEISHGGVHAFETLLDGRAPLGVSDWPEGVGAMSPDGPPPVVNVMDHAMLQEVKRRYVAAVGRCVMGGFDAVTIHLGHGWLMAQFLSPVFNRRTDEYGGSFENRLRFPLEVLSAIREKFGKQIAIDVRISGATRVDPAHGELSDEELIRVAQAVEPYVDMMNVSVSWAPYRDGSEYMCMSYLLPHMDNAKYAGAIRQKVGVPVTATGSITTLAEAETLLQQGVCDLVGIGRANLADDGLVWKSLRGMEDRVRPCLRCAWCTGRLQPPFFRKIRCSVNPMLGRELEYRFLPCKSPRPQKVMIIGGGPAGMQAAQTAVMRGHEVTLYEKEDHLGGMLPTAAALPFKEDMRRYTQWMVDETLRCGAKVVLNTQVTPERIEREQPDVVLVAIGAEVSLPPIPGLVGENVVWAGDVDAGRADTGERVIVAGAGLTGAECAIGLAQQGKQVTIVDQMPPKLFLRDASGQVMLSVSRLHQELGIHQIFNASICRIEPDGLVYRRETGEEVFLKGDTVVNALGMYRNEEEVERLSSVVPITWAIGDCGGGPMTIMNATDSGFTYAMEV